ncbi:MAG: choice-of-anchor D domain-containing protein, partial [bacterium]|nr:choice-of-anchor D domain-containing protein [bacterium]
GSATVELVTDGSVTGTQEVFGTANVTVSGTVYRLADPSIDNSPIAFGNVHVGDIVAAQAVSITNNAANDTFSENLNATTDGTTGGVMSSGSFSGLGPEGTNSTDITVNINSSSAGDKSGTATIDFESDGDGINSLGQTTLGSQTVNVSGAVYRYAEASAHSPEPVVLGNVHVGDTSEQALTIGNTAATDGYSESMNASIGAATGDATAAGSINLLAAGGSDSASLVVGVDTSTAGAKSGTASIGLVSDGSGTSELGQTA